MKKIFRFLVVFTILMGSFTLITNTGEVQAARIPTEEEENSPKTRAGDGNACDNVLNNGSTAIFGANAWNGTAFYHTFKNHYSSTNNNVYNPVVSQSALPKLHVQMHTGNEFSIRMVFTITSYNRTTGQVYVKSPTGSIQFWAYPTYMIETKPGQGTNTCVSTYQ